MTLEKELFGPTNPSVDTQPASGPQSLPCAPATTSEPTDPLLTNLWAQLDRIQPTIPDRISTAVLEGVGIQLDNSDVRLARLVSLAGQKFLTDILTDAMSHWRIANGLSTGLLSSHAVATTPSAPATSSQGLSTPSSNANTSNAPSPALSSSTVGKPSTPGAKGPCDRRATLTLEDLIASLNDHGIHVARPPYYR
ncbi:unnamed protein product [Calicophoron daubneyi]|uniref:Transcription initiation factor TFIID subunit 10 n=1 Tax=Calicophoron daubneyi TaxID=300641 RepID=A0AAV2TW90_CALDB